jgi:hypothetical protein
MLPDLSNSVFKWGTHSLRVERYNTINTGTYGPGGSVLKPLRPVNEALNRLNDPREIILSEKFLSC